METGTIIQLIMSAILAVIGYFMQILHSDVRRNTKELGENKGKIQEVSNEVKHEKEMRQTQFATIKESLEEIKELVRG